METIPNRASDAGPERAEQIPDWRDHIEEARCELDWVSSYKSEHDDLRVRREIRVLRLKNAKDEIDKAIAAIQEGVQ